MKRILLIFSVMLALAAASCSHNDNYDDMPQKVQNFIAQYYPNSEVSNFSSTYTTYTLIIKNGPTIVFNSDCVWTQINGNGMPLPKELLFNDFPPVLYNYLQETENTGNVFTAIRDSKEYIVELLDYTLTYNIASAEITGSSEPVH
ncbi:MAG: hypothetical protein NC102_05140 [Clostridium sp.]|nr:hypothetical protein [Clostridium sp.]